MKVYSKFKELIDNNNPMFLLGSDGSCSCGYLDLFGLTIKSHCWRSGNNCKCKYSGIHIRNTSAIVHDFKEEELSAIGNLFAEYIRTAYRTEVEVVIEPSN